MSLRHIFGDGGHASCSQRLSEIEDRLSRLEGKLAEVNLTVLETAEKVAARLQDRQRKRVQTEEQEISYGELLARARARYGGVK